MDTLDDTEWDIIIDGTGISQSLLALSLSRSDKKILHVDKNDYYGGSEAAFSLQEAQDWVGTQKEDDTKSNFRNVTIGTPSSGNDDAEGAAKLSFPRAYSIALAPQLIYTDSLLLSMLVKSKVHQQVEFLPVGAWWIYNSQKAEQEESSDKHNTAGRLIKVPTNREDIAFSDAGLDLRSKRALVRVIRFVSEYEAQESIWQPYAEKPFADFLQEHFKVPANLHGLLLSLCLTPFPSEDTTTAFALPRIAQHLRSTGRLGPGFSAVTPRWGGLSEICQVGCRAAAVGGAIYALKQQIAIAESDSASDTRHFVLDKGDQVRSSAFVTSSGSLKEAESETTWVTRSISIIGGSLNSLFPEMPAGSPPSAGTVVVFPSGSISGPRSGTDRGTLSPVYLIVHNHHTGECPKSQCVVYASTLLAGAEGVELVDVAVSTLLATTASVGASTAPVLWSMHFEQRSPSKAAEDSDNAIHRLPSPVLDIVFDDSTLNSVRDLWRKLVGEEIDEDAFMNFPARVDNDDI